MDPKTKRTTDTLWRTVFAIGGIAALVAVGGILLDIVYGSVASGDLSQLPSTASERFVEFHDNPWIGLYHLDLLNVLVALLMIPTFFALAGAHRTSFGPLISLVMLVFVVGTIFLVSANVALPMLELSAKYNGSTLDESQRFLYLAAGEALLARGAHGGYGVFLGFLLSEIANLGFSAVMLKGRLFKKLIPTAGLIGHLLLMAYTVLVTFVPSSRVIAMAIAAPGGLLVLVWQTAIGVKLIRLCGLDPTGVPEVH
jgi:hypothetical protein